MCLLGATPSPARLSIRPSRRAVTTDADVHPNATHCHRLIRHPLLRAPGTIAGIALVRVSIALARRAVNGTRAQRGPHPERYKGARACCHGARFQPTRRSARHCRRSCAPGQQGKETGPHPTRNKGTRACCCEGHPLRTPQHPALWQGVAQGARHKDRPAHNAMTRALLR